MSLKPSSPVRTCYKGSAGVVESDSTIALDKIKLGNSETNLKLVQLAHQVHPLAMLGIMMKHRMASSR